MDRDQRKHPREQIECLILIGRSRSISKMATVMDLSVGGIRFYSAILGVEVGDTLHVELVLHGEPVMVVGTVVRVSGLDGTAREISLAFSEVDHETQRLLAETLASDEL